MGTKKPESTQSSPPAREDEKIRLKPHVEWSMMFVGMFLIVAAFITFMPDFDTLAESSGLRFPFSGLLLTVLIVSVAFVAIQLVSMWGSIRNHRTVTVERQKIAEVLKEVAPDLPRDQIEVPPYVPPTRLQLIATALGAFAAMMVGELAVLLAIQLVVFFPLTRFAPIALLFFIPPFTVFNTLVNHFVPGLRDPGAEVKPLGLTLAQNLARMVVTMGGLIVIILMLGDVITALIVYIFSDVAGLLIGFITIYVLIYIIRTAQGLLPTEWVFAAVRSADYDSALWRAKPLLSLSPKSLDLLSIKEGVLAYQGRTEEALALVNQCLARGMREAHPAYMAGWISSRGSALIFLGRDEEAIACCEAAARLQPSLMQPVYAMAAFELRDGGQPQRALALAERAEHLHRAQHWLWRWSSRHVPGQLWSIKAGAHARLGDFDAAQKALDEAFRTADKGFRPEMATLNTRAARVARLKGDAALATERLNTAVTLDPEGLGGQIARKALKT